MGLRVRRIGRAFGPWFLDAVVVGAKENDRGCIGVADPGVDATGLGIAMERPFRELRVEEL